MTQLLHQLILDTAERTPDGCALQERDLQISYDELARQMRHTAGGMIRNGIEANDRVAVFLPKQCESVVAFFAASYAGAVFVPVNPQLKPAQVQHILQDCAVRMLITSAQRLQSLEEMLATCPGLDTVVLVDGNESRTRGCQVISWQQLNTASAAGRRRIDMDLAALLYTSGSTGRPKGVMLSHRNMVCGAHSVASYLGNTRRDRLLTVLPFSFDYGFSQLTTAFYVGACAVLFDYLLPRDVIRAVERNAITGLAGVPPLWNQLAQLDWGPDAVAALRYITNSGGVMPTGTLASLRRRLPGTKVYLMYGLTEAFRSTYLDPAELDRRPGSMGKAIPNAEVMVVRPDGSPCGVDEPGELVHRGSLVALGYWNDADKTAQRFRPVPQPLPGSTLQEIAVWSGDTVRRDAEGFLYFVGRNDEMIKTSGYRVSPAEVEEVLNAIEQVDEAVAVGVPHPELGQAIVAVVTAGCDAEAILAACRNALPSYMVPRHVAHQATLPRNPNGKIDRPTLAQRFRELFESA